MVSSSVGLCNLETGWNKNNGFAANIWKYKPFPLKATFNGYLISVSGTKVSRTILTCATVWNVPKRCWTRTASSSGDSSKISSRPPTSTSQVFLEWFSFIDPVLRIAGDAKCQQFSKWKGHLQKGFRLCPFQVGTRILQIICITIIIILHCSTKILKHLCRRHIESSKHFSEWCEKHLTKKKPLDHETFVSVVTRLNGLYVLVETPQQNSESSVDDEGGGGEVWTDIKNTSGLKT